MKNALFVVLLTCFALGADGQEKQQISKAKQAAPKKAAGSEADPFFVRPHKSAEEESDDKQVAKDVKENLQIQRDTLKVNRDMLVANQKSAHYTKRGMQVAFAAAIGVIIALLVSIAQWYVAWRQLGMFRLQLGLMKSEMATTQAIFEAENRPWITLDVEITKHLIPESDNWQIGVSCKIKNIGKSPAIVKCMPLVRFDIIKDGAAFKEIATEAATMANIPNMILFPQKDHAWSEMSAGFYQEAKDRIVLAKMGTDGYRMDLVACVSYSWGGRQYQTCPTYKYFGNTRGGWHMTNVSGLDPLIT